MCHFPKTMGELMDHQCHSEFQFCIEAISMGGREGERAERKEGEKVLERNSVTGNISLQMGKGNI